METATIRPARFPCPRDVMARPCYTKTISKQGGMFELGRFYVHFEAFSDGHSPTSYSCSAYKIFPTEGADGSEAILKYGCLINWGADSIYRSLPARFASSTAAPEITATASISATTGRLLLPSQFWTGLNPKYMYYLKQIQASIILQQALDRLPSQLQRQTADRATRRAEYRVEASLESSLDVSQQS